MDAADRTDAALAAPAVGIGRGDDEGRDFPVGSSRAFLGLIIAAVGTVLAAMLLAIVFAAAGAHNISKNHAFVLGSTLAQDSVFVITAIAVTSEARRVTPATFGLRRFGPSAFAVMAMLLAATNESLAALFFGIFAGERDLLDHLGVPEGLRPIGALLLGYAAATDHRSPSLTRGRRPVGEVVHWGRWGGTPEP